MPHRPTAFFGWYGLAFEHPAPWELARVSGNRRAGYVVFDDGERARLEISWKPVGAKAAVADLAERQVSTLEKAANRRGVPFAVERGRRIGRVRGFEYEAWSWRADVSAVELLARCEKCSRAALVRVLGPKDAPPDDEARTVFASLECQCGGDVERWGAFGLDVKVPSEFELEHSALKAGLCELAFSDKKIELRVLRASLGRMVLEKKKLVAWFEEIAADALKPFEVSWTKCDVRGHPGYSGAGDERANRRLLRVFRSKRAFAARLFFCEPSDKIYAVSADGAGDVSPLAMSLADGIVCHR